MIDEVSTEGIDPTVEQVGDKVHRVVRSVTSMIPVVGGGATEIFNSLITPPLEKRKMEWMLDITEAVNQLSK